jgi:DNA-binding beta-propeller fold protein YncE
MSAPVSGFWWPPAAAADGKTVYCDTYNPFAGGTDDVTPDRGLFAVDIATNQVVRTFETRRLRAPKVAADGATLYLDAGDRIAALDVASGEHGHLPPEWTWIERYAIAPDGSALYVFAVNEVFHDVGGVQVQEFVHGVAVVALPQGTAAELAVLPEDMTDPLVAVTPDGARLCLVSRSSSAPEDAPQVLRVFRTADLVPGPLPAGPRVVVGNGPVALAVSDDHAFVASDHQGQVRLTRIAIDSAHPGVLTVPLPPVQEPADVAVTSDGRFVYVTDTAGGTAALLDGRTLAVVAPSIPVGRLPAGMAIAGVNRAVCVRTTDGTGLATLRVPPVVTGVEPAELARPEGAVGGTVTIRGSALDEVVEVRFGTTPAQVVGPAPGPLGTALRVVAPLVAGPQPVTVRTGAGLSSDADPPPVFRYRPRPVVTELDPTAGPATGGTTVRIVGAHLDDTVAVVVDGDDVTAFTVDPDGGAVEFTTGPSGGLEGPPALVRIAVRTPLALTNALPFRYLPVPTLIRVAPAAGPLGGRRVTLGGDGLRDVVEVRFGGALATGVTIVDDTTLDVAAPARPAGPAPVTVRTPGGTSAPPVPYEYLPAPTVTALSEPSAVPGVAIFLAGGHLGRTTEVRFGTTPAEVLQIDDDRILVTVPDGTGTVDVTATSPGGTSAPVPFTYL